MLLRKIDFATMLLIGARLMDDPRFAFDDTLSGSMKFWRISDGKAVFIAIPGRCGFVFDDAKDIEPLAAVLKA